MHGERQFDSSIVERLPLPLAQLYSRGFHAKTPLERHQTAYYLWEAAVKYLAAVAIVEDAARDESNGARSEWLNRGGQGAESWWKILKRLSQGLGEIRPEFTSLEGFLSQPLSDTVPHSAALYSLLADGETLNAGSQPRVSDLYDRLASYGQNQLAPEVLGRKTGDYCERVGWGLLLGVSEGLKGLAILTERPLVFLADVRQQSQGTWLIERLELRGETPTRLESLLLPADVSLSHLPKREQLYLAHPARSGKPLSCIGMQPLHPWLIFHPESNEVFFLHSGRNGTTTTYVCYSTGRLLSDEPLDEKQPTLSAMVWDAAGNMETANNRGELSLPADPPRSAENPRDNPRRLGEFELVSCLGRGGMGVVYRAWHLPLKRQVGLKCMLRRGDAKSEARFAREIRALGRVHHPHLVKIYSSGTDRDQMFYAMELVEGTDLFTVWAQLRSQSGSNPKQADWDRAVSAACRITQNREVGVDTDDAGPSTTVSVQLQVGPEGVEPLGEQTLVEKPALAPATDSSRRSGISHSRNYVGRVVDVIRQVAEATHALHEAHIVHRDIKPGNIMLAAGGEAVLMDLGLAQLADETEGRLTHTLDYVGTLRYSSPEQLRAASHVDRRTDIYSLGATLWELLTLQPLFGAGKTTSPAQLMIDIQSSAPHRPRHWNPRIPPDLEVIVLKCLEKTPSRRYATAEELAADLRRWQQGLPVQAQPPTLRYVLGKHIQRHWMLLSALAAIVFLAVLAGSWSVYQINQARNAAVTAFTKEKAAREQATRYLEELEEFSYRMINLGDFPSARAQGADLIGKTLAAYERLVAEKSGDRARNLLLASARFHAGKAYENLELIDKSEREWRLVVDALEKLHLSEAENEGLRLKDQARIQRGRVLSELGRDREAEECFATAAASLQLASKKNPHPLTQELIGQLAIEMGKLRMKQNHLQEAKAQFDDAAATFEKLLKKYPEPAFQQGLATALTNSGRLQVREGAHEAGVETIRKSVAQLIALEAFYDTPEVREAKGIALIELGNALRPLGDDAGRIQNYREALATYESLLAAFPNVPRLMRIWSVAATNLAYVLHKQGQNQEAYQLVEKALNVTATLRRGEAFAWEDALREAVGVTLAGQILHQLGKFPEAEQVFGQALEMLAPLSEGDEPDPRLRERRGLAWTGRGRAMLALQHYEEAEEALQKAIAEFHTARARHAAPEQITEHLAWARSFLGDVYFQSKRQKLAQAQYAEVLNLRESLEAPEQLHDRAQFLTMCPDPKICRPEVACELAARAHAKCRNNPRYLAVLGLACLRTGQCDEALEHLQAALDCMEENARHPFAYLCLALVHQQQNRMDEAQTAYETARGLALSDQNAGDARLKQLIGEVEQGFAHAGP